MHIQNAHKLAQFGGVETLPSPRCSPRCLDRVPHLKRGTGKHPGQRLPKFAMLRAGVDLSSLGLPPLEQLKFLANPYEGPGRPASASPAVPSGSKNGVAAERIPSHILP